MVRPYLLFAASLLALTSLVEPAAAIQIEQNTVTQNGVVVEDTLTIGITVPQLLFGPIAGFFVNLIFYPFLGPLPEITSFEFDLLGAADIAPDGQAALFAFQQPVTDPIDAVARVTIDFKQFAPPGTVATYELTSLDSAGQALETLNFDVAAPIPEPSFGIPVAAALLLLGSLTARMRSTKR